MYNFIHIPKVAGSSMYQIIGGGRPINYCGHISPQQLNFFCFVRNPYDRILDAYLYLLKGGGQTDLDLSYQKKLQEYKSFEEFTENLGKLRWEIIHLYPMYWFATYHGKTIKYFKIETDMNQIDEFLTGMGYEALSSIQVNVTELNTSELTKKAIENINEHYRKDFELFGYENL